MSGWISRSWFYPKPTGDPGRDRNAVLVPPDDIDTAVQPGVDTQRTMRRLHAQLANLAVARARTPVTPTLAAIREPFVVTLLCVEQSCGKNNQGDGQCADKPNHEELRR